MQLTVFRTLKPIKVEHSFSLLHPVADRNLLSVFSDYLIGLFQFLISIYAMGVYWNFIYILLYYYALFTLRQTS